MDIGAPYPLSYAKRQPDNLEAAVDFLADTFLSATHRPHHQLNNAADLREPVNRREVSSEADYVTSYNMFLPLLTPSENVLPPLDTDLQKGAFCIVPKSIQIPPNLNLVQIKRCIEHLPTPLAARILAHTLEKLPQLALENSDDFDRLIIIRTINDQPLHKRLALAVALPVNTIQFTEDEQSSIATSLYRDHRTFVDQPQSHAYKESVSQWLNGNKIKTFSIASLFQKKSCLPLFDNQNKNSVLFITDDELSVHGSSLNGLLESGKWEIDDLTDIVWPRIVVIGDKKSLSSDLLSRLCCHEDAVSYKRYSKSLCPSRSNTPNSNSSVDRTTEHESITQIMDAHTLLNSAYQTVQSYFESSLKNGADVDPSTPLLISTHEEVEYLKKASHNGSPLPPICQPVRYPMVHTSVSQLPNKEHNKERNIILLDGVSDINDLLEYYFARITHSSPPSNALNEHLKTCKVFVNSYTNASLLGSVYQSKEEGAIIKYRNAHFSVASIALSKFNFDERAIDVNTKESVSLSPEEKKQLKKYYESGTLDTNNHTAQAILNALLRFMENDRPLQILEGPPGIGKDVLTRHLATQMQSLKPDALTYKHITAGYDISLIDHVLNLRKKYRDCVILLHVSEGNLFDTHHWRNLMLLMNFDKKIKVIATQNPTEVGGRFDLSKLFTDPQSQAGVLKLDSNDQQYPSQNACDPTVYDKHAYTLTLNRTCLNNIKAHKEAMSFDSTRPPTNRQVSALIKALSNEAHSDTRALFEAIYRAYGLYEPHALFAYNNQILLTQSVESTDGETDGETKIFEALYELDHPTAPASADIISAPLEEEEDYYSDKPSDPQPIWIGNNHCYTTRPSLSSAQGLPEIQLLSDNTTQELEHAFSRKEIQPGQKIELLILPNITSDLFLNIDEHGATQGRTPGQEEDKKEDKAEDDDAYPIFLAMLQYEPVTYNDLEFEDLEFEDLENDDLSLVHQDNGYSIESNHGRHFFVNTKDVPIDLTIHYNAPTTLLSERCSKNSFTNNSFNALKASQAPITLTRDEEAFIAAFLQASHEAGDRRTALASILGISDHQNAADVIFSTFKYMNRYLDAPFDCKPYMGEALSEKYTHLLHSILSKKGVCRHQAEIMHTFLNVFNIPSTLHTNATHTFLTLEDSTIIDLDYFSSPSAQNQYEHLCEQACTASERLTRSREKRSREKNNIPEQQKQALQSLIERAQPYIDYPHGDNTTPETFATLIEQFDQALQPFSPPLTQTAAVPTPAPKAKSTPVRTSQSVCASPKPIDHINIDHNNFISLLDDNQISPDQLYNTLTQSIDHNHGYQPWLMALESTNLKKRIHPPETDHTDPTASLKRRKVDYHDNTSSNIKTNIRVALKVIVSHMLSALPEETQTIQKFIPKGDDTVLPARAKEVSGGFIVNMTTPSPTIKKEIRLDLPDTFADEFILLTNHGPITISSQEGLKQITDHNHYTPLKLKSDLTSEINTFLQQYL